MSKFTEESFDVVYEKKIVPHLTTIEVNRKKTAGSLKKLIIIAVLSFIAAMILNSQGAPATAIWAVIITASLAAAYFGYESYKAYGIYRKSFKTNVVRPLLKSIDEAITYHPERSIPKRTYDDSELFLHGVDRYEGDDFFEGAIGSTDFIFSELHTQYKTESTDSKGNRRTTWHTIFQGIFMSADFHKNIKSETVVLTDQAESFFGKTIGKFLQSKNVSRDQLVKMEDVEFEKHFVVYSDDQIDARYILTPDMMKRILDIKIKMESDIQLSFKGSRVYIAINFGRTLFEPSSIFSKMKKDDIEGVYTLITTVLAVIDDLNLNTRIWTKD